MSDESKPESKAASESNPNRPIGPLQAVGWLFVLTLTLVGAIAGALIYRLITPPEPQQEVVRVTPDVVGAVQDLARLETARVHIERVIDLRDRSSTLFGLVDGEDAILLVAAADVSAGIDLESIAPDAITVDPDRRTVRVELPPPELFDARLDGERTYVHTRETSTFVRPSATLETRARREAESTLRSSALDAGLLDRARENGRATLRALLISLDFQQIDIVFTDEAASPQMREPR
ncbi:MAG: DUF4230 domain-containing protein [Myxococcota bacterium]